MFVILYNIRSGHNVGSIFRTASATGVEKIYLCGYTPLPVNEFGKINQKITKTALGAEKLVSWEKIKSVSRLIAKLKREGYEIIALEQDKRAIAYNRIRPKKKSALILGNEVSGLSKIILDKCDQIVEIPMSGRMIKEKDHPRRTQRGKESLNVSVAFGIALFGMLK